MHPLLVLLAFSLAALVTYVLVLGLLTALSIPQDAVEEEAPSESAAQREHARG